jgi:energy-coupling factor transport system ATP-binding protein
LLKNCYFRYEKNGDDVIKGLNFAANYGEITAVLGGNGAGKSTMLGLVSGINKAYRGKVVCGGAVRALPQDPQMLFAANTVLDNLREISGDAGEIKRVMELCRLGEILERHPFDLSGGEQQRAALAMVLLVDTRPQILLLDEPTKGFDGLFKQEFAQILHQLKASGTAIILVSHDIEFCAQHADICALFFGGDIITTNTPRNFFSKNTFYTTAANRMAREILPRAIVAGDIIGFVNTMKE